MSLPALNSHHPRTHRWGQRDGSGRPDSRTLGALEVSNEAI